MSAVVISRSLRSSLGDSPALELAKDFHDYKVTQTVSFGGSFGRDKPFEGPAEARYHSLWHVHLEGDSGAVWDRITDNWDSGKYTQDNYTSDSILVYAKVWDVVKTPYLLLTILSPDGHAQMSDNQRMKAICALFKQEIDDYRKFMPSSDWIVV